MKYWKSIRSLGSSVLLGRLRSEGKSLDCAPIPTHKTRGRIADITEGVGSAGTGRIAYENDITIGRWKRGNFHFWHKTEVRSAIKSEGDPLEMQHSRSQPGNEAESGTNYSEATCEIDQEHESGDDGR